MANGADEVIANDNYCTKAILEPLSSLSIMVESGESVQNDPMKGKGGDSSGPAMQDAGSGEDAVTKTEDKSSESKEEVSLNRPPTGKWTQLEDYKRFSDSILWTFMMNFYDQKGVDSWSQGIVPFFITSNAYIGRTYAKLLQGLLFDLSLAKTKMASQMKLQKDEKLYIVELGAGAGKFSFFMLKALDELKNVLDFPLENIVYVLTDFTESNLNFWKDHHALKPFVESGRLDFAIFDASNDDKIVLRRSGKVLSRDQPTGNPICVIANYIFDTLCHDIFHVDGGVLKEGVVSVGSSQEGEPDLRDPEIIEHIQNKYKYHNCDIDYYKGVESDVDAHHFSQMLRWYQEFFSDNDPAELGASVLVPVGSIRALRNISDASESGMIVLAGDKANCHPEAFRGLVDPHFAIHGSFSVMANFHAVGIYCTSRGGFAMHNQSEEASLQVSCFFIPGSKENGQNSSDAFKYNELEKLDEERASQFPMLQQSFNDNVNSFGPSDFFAIQRCLKEEARPSLANVVALLKLSNWDPDIYFKFRDLVLVQVSSASCKLRSDLIKGMPHIWANYFELDKEKDVAFEIGRFYYGVLKYSEALKYYGISTNTLGEHHVTYHNMGLCQYSLGNLDSALTYFRKALALKKTYEKASNWIEKVTRELSDESKKQN